MTTVKSLKYKIVEIGHGHFHRVHRSKKNRRPHIHSAKVKNYKLKKLKLKDLWET